MDFAYSAEQETWRATVRAFLDERVPVTASRAAAEPGTPHDAELWRRMGELGLHGLHIEDKFGGQGFGPEELAIVVEELGRALVCSPYLASTGLAATALAAAGDAEFLPAVARGERVATLANLNPGGDWDPYAGEVAELRAGLDGRKRMVAYATAADLLIATAVRDGTPVLVAVEAGAPGVDRTDITALDLTSRWGTVAFAGAKATVVAEGDHARAAVRQAERYANILAAADMIGGSAACLEAAVSYAGQRHQFGRPIGSFQAIKHLCADMLAELELARSAVLYAVWALGAGSPEVDRAASLAQALASDAYLFIADAALHVHGGMGFTWEHDSHLYLRRARASSLLYGDATHHGEHFLRLSLGQRQSASQREEQP